MVKREKMMRKKWAQGGEEGEKVYDEVVLEDGDDGEDGTGEEEDGGG